MAESDIRHALALIRAQLNELEAMIVSPEAPVSYVSYLGRGGIDPDDWGKWWAADVGEPDERS